MFKIKNYEIQSFGEFLMKLELKGKDSRMRTRLVKLLQERLDLIGAEREQILKDYAAKDDDGEVVRQEYNGQSGIKIQDVESYNRETLVLMNEEYKVALEADKADIFKSVAHSVLECDLAFSGEEALQYDRWCELLEELEV